MPITDSQAKTIIFRTESLFGAGYRGVPVGTYVHTAGSVIVSLDVTAEGRFDLHIMSKDDTTPPGSVFWAKWTMNGPAYGPTEVVRYVPGPWEAEFLTTQ